MPEVTCGMYFDTGMETWDDAPISEPCGKLLGHEGRHGWGEPSTRQPEPEQDGDVTVYPPVPKPSR